MTARHLQLGEDVEKKSLVYLQSKGLTLVEKNYRSKYGEIDLVMMDKADLVFVEVRYRKNSQFGGAKQSVNFEKQQKLRRTAEFFLQQESFPDFDGCRFDVVAVSGQPPSYIIDWISDAF